MLSSFKLKRTISQKGFTLVEAVISLTLMSVVVLVLFGFIFSTYNANNDADIQATAANDVQTALNRIEEDINLSKGFDIAIAAPFSDSFGPDNAGAAWSHTGSSATSRALIIKGYATTTHPKNINKSPVYINSYGCTTDLINSNPILETRIIYFVNNNKLYRRTLTDTTKTLCNPQYQKQTCASGYSNAACLETDVLVLENVTNFSINYYASASSTTPIAAYTTPIAATILSNATTAEYTLGTTRVAAGNTYSYQSMVRATKLN